jgi:hypothetical protein
MAIKYNCFCLWKHHVNVLLINLRGVSTNKNNLIYFYCNT